MVMLWVGSAIAEIRVLVFQRSWRECHGDERTASFEGRVYGIARWSFAFADLEFRFLNGYDQATWKFAGSSLLTLTMKSATLALRFFELFGIGDEHERRINTCNEIERTTCPLGREEE